MTISVLVYEFLELRVIHQSADSYQKNVFWGICGTKPHYTRYLDFVIFLIGGLENKGKGYYLLELSMLIVTTPSIPQKRDIIMVDRHCESFLKGCVFFYALRQNLNFLKNNAF